MASRLGQRLTVAFIVVGAGSALLTALLVNVAFGNRFDAYQEQQRQARERQLASAFTAAYDPSQGWQVERLDSLAPLVAMTGAEVRLDDDAGRFVWSLGNAQMGPEMAQMHRDMTSAGPLLPPERVSLDVRGEPVGELLISLPQGTLPVADKEFRSAVNRLLIVGGLVAGALSVGMGLVITRRTLRPITALTDAARDLRAGDRSRRTTVEGNDEIAQMAQAFNELVDSLEREDEVRRAFAADVAHELRTPLAVLRSQLEAVQDGVIEPGTAVFGSLHDETLRLGRLVADLEMMTSADSAEFDLHPSPVDLASVVSGAVAGLGHRFDEERLQLVSRTRPVVVSGDKTRLQQVVTNLLTNAVKFVPPGGAVVISTQRVGPWAELTICDDGPGIPTEDLDHIFERFYRGHQVRTGGSGIGLAVVAALVQAHGGEVTASNQANGGACFRVRLPVSDAEIASPVPT
jgi:two-component system sensor histidine kinase BaeS